MLEQSTYLDAFRREVATLTTAARQGLGIEGMSLHSYTGDCPPGLVLGHAYMAEPAIERGMPLPAGTGLTRRSLLLRGGALALSVYGASHLRLGDLDEGKTVIPLVGHFFHRRQADGRELEGTRLQLSCKVVGKGQISRTALLKGCQKSRAVVADIAAQPGLLVAHRLQHAICLFAP